MIDKIVAKDPENDAEMENQGSSDILPLEKIRGVAVDPFENEKEIPAQEVKKAKQILLTKYVPALKPDVQIIKKVPSHYQARSLVQDLFDTLKKNKGAFLFNEPLDPNHYLFHEIKNDFITLNMIEIYFKIGSKYQTTQELGKSIRQMIVKKFEMNVGNTDLTNYNLIQAFFDEFETNFKDLENLRLVKSTEQIEPNSEVQQKRM